MKKNLEGDEKNLADEYRGRKLRVQGRKIKTRQEFILGKDLTNGSDLSRVM